MPPPPGPEDPASDPADTEMAAKPAAEQYERRTPETVISPLRTLRADFSSRRPSHRSRPGAGAGKSAGHEAPTPPFPGRGGHASVPAKERTAAPRGGGGRAGRGPAGRDRGDKHGRDE